MKLTDAQLSTITDAAWDADLKVRSYSGRAMFGEHCLGLQFYEIRNLAKFFISLAADDASLAGDLALRLRTDSLGLGEIAYFPGIESDEDDEDEDED